MQNLKLITAIIAILLFNNCSKDDSGTTGNTGIGGSLARFTITKNHLYVVDREQLYTFSLQDPARPKKINTLPLGFNSEIETIYPWKDKLFLGSARAMYVISIADSSNPKHAGTASHVRACDPVVANDNFAYVTVRSGTNCLGNTNALHVFDIKTNPEVPKNVAEFGLKNPHGLALYKNFLYVCDAEEGIKVFDITQEDRPKLVTTTTGHIFYDCIAVNNVLITMVEKGMVLYDISAPGNPTLISQILN